MCGRSGGDDVQLYQFLGKGNVAYHTVIFPGSQIGMRAESSPSLAELVYLETLRRRRALLQMPIQWSG